MLNIPFVDEDFIHASEKTRMIEEFLTKNKKVFEGLLIGDLRHINYRAQNLNGIQIEDIEHTSGNQYGMSYTYDWYVYNGCDDMDEQGDETGYVWFTISKTGEVEFDTPDIQDRSTLDEF